MDSSVSLKFSALGSVYSGEKASHLDQALESLYKQTLPANEVVLVHDGLLTDELYSCLDRWSKLLPLKELKMKKAGRLARALNFGLTECSREWVARFDSDDVNRPIRFEVQLGYLQKNPDLSVLSSAIEEFSQKPGDLGRIRSLPITHQSIARYTVVRSPFNHPSVVFKKSDILSAGGYPVDTCSMEDYALWLRVIARGGKCFNISTPLVDARVGKSDMVKRRRGISYVKDEIKIYQVKRKLGLDNTFRGLGILALRVAPRLLPTKALSLVYSLLRKSTSSKTLQKEKKMNSKFFRFKQKGYIA